MAEDADAPEAAAAAAELDDDDLLPAEEVVVLSAEVVFAGDERGVALPVHQRVMSYGSYVTFGQYLV